MPGDAGNQITVWSIVSLLAGTIISAIVSYLLQRRSFSEARQEKEKDKFEARKTLGLNLFHKMIRIASTLEILKRSLDESLANPENVDGQPWQIVMPLANFPNRVKFTPEELTFLMQTDMTLFNDMAPFDDIQDSLLGAFELYRTKRMALTDTLPANMSGSRGTTYLNEAGMKKIAPKAAELNSLIQGMNQRTQQDSKEAWELLEKLRNLLNKEFNLQLRSEQK